MAWWQTLVSLPPGETPVEAPFLPEWWVIYPEELIAGKVKVFLGPEYHAHGITLTEYNSLTLPHVSSGRKIFLYNADALTYLVNIIAGTGVAPVITLPVTLASLDKVIPLSTTYKIVDQADFGLSASWAHAHAGKYVIVLLIGLNTDNADPGALSLTIDGSLATTLLNQKLYAGSSVSLLGAFRHTSLVASVNIAASWGAAKIDHFYAVSLSFADGVAFGNVGSGSRAGAGALSLVINGQDETSYLMSIVNALGSSLSESGGADQEDKRSFAALLAGVAGRWTLRGKGGHAFNYTTAGDTYALALEAYAP